MYTKETLPLSYIPRTEKSIFSEETAHTKIQGWNCETALHFLLLTFLITLILSYDFRMLNKLTKEKNISSI